MKKKGLIFAAVALALLLYFRPLPFPELSYDAGGEVDIQKVDLSIADGAPYMTSTRYTFAEGSPEAEAVGEILARCSYHRALRSPFPNTDLDGNDVGYWLHIWGGDFYFSSGGTGEITVNDHVYRMGWFGNRKNLALMEEIAAVLAEAQPAEDPE